MACCSTPHGSTLQGHQISLAAFEEVLMLFPSISTVTFYNCEVFPMESLRARIVDMVTKNPWLAAKLVTGPAGKPVLLVPPDPRSLQHVDYHESGYDIPAGMEYLDMTKVLKPLECKTGNDSINKNLPLFRCMVAKTGPGLHALVCSMNHVLGDGHTFYKIYGMLDEKASTEALSREVPKGYRDSLAQALGPEFLADIEDMSNMVPTLASAFSPFKPKPKELARCWNLEWVDQEKQKHKASSSDVPFVSTNDILTSWCIQNIGTTGGQMAVNCRGKVAGLADGVAGNYECILSYRPEDAATPADIRKSISTPGSLKPVSGQNYIKSKWAKLTAFDAFCTNWSTFWTEVKFTGAEHVIHMPFMDWSIIGGALIVIFKPTQETVGSLIYARNNATMERLKTTPELSGDITPGVAPHP